MHRPVDDLVNSLTIPHYTAIEEAGNIASLQALIGQVSLMQVDDKVVWVDDSESFTVKELQKIDRSQITFFLTRCGTFDWDRVWNTQLPSKVSFLVWLLVHRRVLTENNMKRRGFNMVSQCYLCRQSEEDEVHLFLSCPVSQQVLEYFSVG